jgi:Doubled CXXCH motif (Paired_CXXCH_1)
MLLLLLALSQAPQAVPLAAADAETCLACHSDNQLSLPTADGKTIALHVDRAAYDASVHAKLACSACHVRYIDVPHESRGFRSPRELTLEYNEQCRRCHAADYRKTRDSVHQDAVARGDRTAPVCVDCHGSHDIRKPSQPRQRVSETCARCHAGVAAAYAGSVHGRGIGTPAEADLPTCTDCHHAHDTGGPRQERWALATVDVCGRCHGNATLMKKYGLSTSVLTTYLTDFHGKVASLRQHQGTRPTGAVVARCTDCHGVHDIGPTTAPSSPVIRANLQKTCRTCHADANANFPDAWLSHYEPSFAHAPLVFAVKLGYMVIIPFMIGGLGLQILLQLWRLTVRR